MTPISEGIPVSPIELLKELGNRELVPDLIVHGFIVGPADDKQQQEGVISMVDAGMPKVEKYVPVVWIRAQLRCIAGSLSDAERAARHAYEIFADRRRTVIRASDGQDYLLHFTSVSGGPSAHFDSPETWEYLMWVESLVGMTPIPAS